MNVVFVHPLCLCESVECNPETALHRNYSPWRHRECTKKNNGGGLI